MDGAIAKAIAKAQEKITFVSRDKKVLRAYQMREMALSDYISGINHARREGEQEGRQKVIQETLLEITKLLKEGKSIEDISRLFNVSDAK
ncbi:MAG: hypothetical protein LBL94_07140 [Prevotellaceae bacterium]|nr:hypothetical protein [Prevotellaceae bacterium]